MEINVQWISPTHEKLPILHRSVQGVYYDLIIVLGHFPAVLQSWNFGKVEFSYRVSQKKVPIFENS